MKYSSSSFFFVLFHFLRAMQCELFPLYMLMEFHLFLRILLISTAKIKYFCFVVVCNKNSAFHVNVILLELNKTEQNSKINNSNL